MGTAARVIAGLLLIGAAFSAQLVTATEPEVLRVIGWFQFLAVPIATIGGMIIGRR